MVVVLGALEIGTAIFSQQRLSSERTAEKEKIQDVRSHLATFLAEGTQLLIQTRRHRRRPRSRRPKIRMDECSAYLKGVMTPDFAVRFGDASGMPARYTSLETEDGRNLEGGITTRTYRLQPFLSVN